MDSLASHGVSFITLIAGRKRKDDILESLLACNCHLVNIVYAKGTLKTGYFKDMLGLVAEEKKIVVTCLTKSENTDEVLDILNTRFNFNQPNTGIAFVTPVDNLSI